MKLTKKIQLQAINSFKNQKKRLAKECMLLWAECVKAKAKHRCEYCRRRENLNAHHFFSRSRGSVRYNINNGICLCSGCHSLNNHSAHKSPLFKDELIKRGIRTQQWLDLLERQASTPQKLDLSLEKLYLEKIKKELEKYETTR